MRAAAGPGRVPALFPRIVIALCLAATLAACGSTGVSDLLPDRRVDYKKQRVAEEALEVPPDLTGSDMGGAMQVPGVDSGAGTTYSEYSEQRRSSVGNGNLANAAVLPEVPDIKVLRDGDQRWLEIDAPAKAVWPRVVSFWRENGILLVEENPVIGVLKTDWLENRADIKQGFISELFRKVLDSAYSAPTRDQFRLRLEPGERPGTTYMYLTHRGMEEKLQRGSSGETENAYWVSRPNDPGLEAEMLRRLMVYLGAENQRAQTALAKVGTRAQPRSQMVRGRDGSAALLIRDDFGPAWRQVGVALERVGFMVEDRDRTAGVYYVRYDDPMKAGEEEGFFSKLAFWRDDKKFDDQIQYRIRLVPEGEKGEVTRVSIRNADDEPERSDTAARILTLIHEQIH